MSDSVNKVFKSFIDDIIVVFPEYKKRLVSYYKEAIESNKKDHPKIVEFLENMNEISDQVVNKDVTLFESDPIILQNISFKLIWNGDISDQTKNSIWKYLQTFCIINIQSESTNEKISEVLKLIDSKEKVKDKETVKTMKKLKKLNETFDIKELEKVIDENPDSISDGVNQMDTLFENTSIGQIAKEITQDLDIENMIGNGGIGDLLSGGGIANIMKTISSKMSDKEGQFDNDQLMKEASNICGSMEGNPLFTSLLGMQGDLFKNQTQEKPENTKQINLDNSSHNPNITRDRLKRKLKEKQNMTVEKID
tara:strand:- start:1720 stop:2646 length:927 start_codon:yes stop_codon:yes gene_type:complete